MEDEGETLGTDKLRGVPQIARFLGEPAKAVYYMLEVGHLPAGKVGRVWWASKSVLRAHYERITNPPLSTERSEKAREMGANGLAPLRRGRPRKTSCR
jgi:hypothetical protein